MSHFSKTQHKQSEKNNLICLNNNALKIAALKGKYENPIENACTHKYMKNRNKEGSSVDFLISQASSLPSQCIFGTRA